MFENNDSSLEQATSVPTENEDSSSPLSGFGDFSIRPRQRGPIVRGGHTIIGKIAAPPSQEATSGKFWFWVPEDALVEATQIVTTKSQIAGKDMTFYALVEEVHRSSRRRNIGQEVDEVDGDLSDEPPFLTAGITYASASILRTIPAYLTPPRERSPVTLANDQEASSAYGIDEVKERNRLFIGLIKNGGADTAGPGCIDLAYLLGENGGHLNVSGAAGRATKSSFLLNVLYMLLTKARREALELPSGNKNLQVVPIVFNVKGFDLFHIDRSSTAYNPEKHRAEWAAIGIESPGPFEDVTYFAPQQAKGSGPIDTGRTSGVTPYSWSLRDVIEGGLLSYLFSDEDNANDNFMALILDVENYLTEEKESVTGAVTRYLRKDWSANEGKPIDTFDELSTWLRSDVAKNELGRDHHEATRKKLSRRLLKLLYESGGVLRRTDKTGNPLKVVHAKTKGPIVVDLNGLTGKSALQRFVVATVLRQLVDARTGANAVSGLKYLVVLDELNRFAPRGGRDPITKLVETVAAEMRSQGVLLFGAQQQASLVSDRVIENSAVKALGQTGALELRTGVWSSLSDASRRRAEALLPNEKLVLQSGFRQPMHLIVPFPAWAMNPEEAKTQPADTQTAAERQAAYDDLGDI